MARRASTAPRSSARSARRASSSVELYGLFHARKLRVHELALARRLGPRAPGAAASRSRSTTASRRRSRARDFALRPGPLDARSTSSPCCADDRSPRPGALALVLHTHMPYVEGFGTWPFGEEWLWEAVACVYLPLLELLDGAPVTVGLTPVLCDQLEAMRGEPGDRYLRFLREVRAPIHAEDSAGLDARRRAGARGRAAPRRGRLRARRASVRRPRARPGRRVRRARRRRAVDLGRHPRGAAAAGHRRRAAAAARPPASRRTSAPLRRLGRRASGCPSARTRPGSSATSPSTACASFCVDQTDALGLGCSTTSSPVRHRGRAGGRADRLADRRARLDDDARLPGRRRLPRLPPPHRARPEAVEQRGRPYDRAAAWRARARARARLRRAHAARRTAARRPGLLCCALDTELLGHWWYEGAELARGGARRGAAPGLPSSRVSEGARAGRAGARARSRASTLGAAKDLSTWDSPRGRRDRVRGARRRAAHRRGRLDRRRAARRARARRARAARAAVERLGVHDHARARRRLPSPASRGAPRKPRRRPCRSADSSAAPEPRLRQLAPDLDLASLTTP